MTTADGAELLDGTSEWSHDEGGWVPVLLADAPYRGLRRLKWPGPVFEKAAYAEAFARGLIAGWPEHASWRHFEGD